MAALQRRGPPPARQGLRPPRRDEPREYRRLPDEEGATDLDDAARDAVERLVAERSQCKVSRDFRRADEIRDELREKYLVYVSDKDRTWRRTTGRGGPPRRERRPGRTHARSAGRRGGRDVCVCVCVCVPDDAARNATEAAHLGAGGRPRVPATTSARTSARDLLKRPSPLCAHCRQGPDLQAHRAGEPRPRPGQGAPRARAVPL